MDFALSEEEQAIKDVCSQVLGDMCSHERLKTLSAEGDRIDRKAWKTLASTGAAGASIPESYGGLGLGFLASAVALEEVGRHASPVPLLATAVMAAMPVTQFGTAAQKSAWLAGMADGSVLGCTALAEDGAPPAEPTTTARAVGVGSTGDVGGSSTGGGYVIDGTKVLVANGLDAHVALIPARLEDGRVGVFIVPTDTDGLTASEVEITTGRSEARFELTGVSVGPEALLGGPEADGAEIVRFIEQRTNVGLCMMMAGAAQASIALAADYTKQRQQFDRPIATFQAVSQRAGDSYIDAEAIWLTAYQAAWRLSAGVQADKEVAIAKYWACEGGYRVVHAAVHVHGGVGVDRDYPLHRHFLAARHIELTLGHAEEQLTALGHLLAA